MNTITDDANTSVIFCGDMNSLSEKDKQFYEDNNTIEVLKSGSKLREKFLTSGKIDYSIIETFKANAPRLIDLDTESVMTVPTHVLEDKMHATNMRLDMFLGDEKMRGRVLSCGGISNEITNKLSDHYPVILQLK
eukprot:TRINITY_DN5539_c0_g1_i1.p1 TRINITY_DN5539_c0_g1~~TRINITY_DN5539_c0_g1_i1.p1  ORF type:complete len:135 (+),score=10.94 TRINITY_DN5539_c0_g1_i1:1-405(+)